MWLGLVLIIVLTVLSIYGAFIGAERAEQLFNQPPLVVYWMTLAILLIVGIAAFRRLLRVPGLLLIHAGCILIIAGGMWGSQAGHNLQKKLFGIDKIRSGRMKIYEGSTSNMVGTEKKVSLFSVTLEFANSLDRRIIPQNLRQEFKKEQVELSQKASAWVNQAGSMWVIADEPKEYFVRREGSKLRVYDIVREVRELPFAIKLNDFRIEYYQPVYLQIETLQSQWKVPVEAGKEFPLGDDAGTITIVKSYENFKIGMEEGKSVPFDDPSPGLNPAIEVQITEPGGQTSTQYVFERFPGHGHDRDKFLLSYHRVISDYISKLQIIEGGKVVAEKDIEVNHPLRFGGYHFYQYDYDHKASQYTDLEVVSNTGLYVVYAGYWMLCVGAIWHLWFRHVLSRFKVKST